MGLVWCIKLRTIGGNMIKSTWTYRLKKHVCGEYVDCYVYPVWPVARQKPGRKKKRQETRDVQKALNMKHTQQRLGRILNANFTDRDLSLGLDYRQEQTDVEQAKKDIQNFLRRCRRLYKKHGIEFKYVWTVELTKKGRCHFHCVISGGYDADGNEKITRDDIEKLWKHGRANADRLQQDRGGYTGLACYMCKTHKQKKGKEKKEEQRLLYRAYNASKNCVDPEPVVSDSAVRSKRQAADLAGEDLSSWGKILPGHTVDDMEEFYNDDTGHFYIWARLHRDDCVFIKPNESRKQ